jgi:hypothetical protein
MNRTFQKAPSPTRGTSKAVYEVVNELGGATVYEIHKYLPAIESKGYGQLSCTMRKKKLTRKQVTKCISLCVSRGYFIRDDKTIRVAPLSYYRERQARYMASTKKTMTKRDDTKPEITQIKGWQAEAVWTMLAVTALSSFAIGLVVGASL